MLWHLWVFLKASIWYLEACSSYIKCTYIYKKQPDKSKSFGWQSISDFAHSEMSLLNCEKIVDCCLLENIYMYCHPWVWRSHWLMSMLERSMSTTSRPASLKQFEENQTKSVFADFYYGSVRFSLLNPLPHEVLATFCLTAEGLIGPLTEDNISWEKTILMTSRQTYKTSAVRRECGGSGFRIK